MNKTILRYPQAMMPSGRYAPNAFATVMTGLLIYFIYGIALAIYLVIYLTTSVPLNNEFGQMMNNMLDTIVSHELILTILFSNAIITVLTIIFVRFMQKQKVSAMGITKWRWLGEYSLGLLIGLGLNAIFIVPVLLTEPFEYVGIAPLVAVYFAAFVVQASAEEVLFRGYMMPFISQRIGALGGVILSSAVFALLHIANGGQSVLSMLTLFLLGVFFALYTLRTGSLLGACAIHTMWNFSSGLVTDLSVGGLGIDYAIIHTDAISDAPDTSFVGEPGYLVYIIIFLSVIAILLFAGKNRLVTHIPHADWQLGKARRFASFLLTQRFDWDGKPYLHHATAVADMFDDPKEKTAALLQDVCANGKITPQRLRRRGFDDEICCAVAVMTVRQGEDFSAYLDGVRSNALAWRVKTADIQYSLSVVDSMTPSPQSEQVKASYRSALTALTAQAAQS